MNWFGHERGSREYAHPLLEYGVRRHWSSLDESDVLEACQKFSSILLGSGPKLDLFRADEKSEWVDCRLIRKDMDKSTQPVVDATFESSNITETWCISIYQSIHVGVRSHWVLK